MSPSHPGSLAGASPRASRSQLGQGHMSCQQRQRLFPTQSRRQHRIRRQMSQRFVRLQTEGAFCAFRSSPKRICDSLDGLIDASQDLVGRMIEPVPKQPGDLLKSGWRYTLPPLAKLGQLEPSSEGCRRRGQNIPDLAEPPLIANSVLVLGRPEERKEAAAALRAKRSQALHDREERRARTHAGRPGRHQPQVGYQSDYVCYSIARRWEHLRRSSAPPAQRNHNAACVKHDVRRRF